MSEPAEPVLGGETRDRLEAPLNLDAIRDNLHHATQVRLQEAAAMRGVGEDLEALLGEVSRLREREKELEAAVVELKLLPFNVPPTRFVDGSVPSVEGSPDP